MATLFPLANTSLSTPSSLGGFSSTPKVNPSVASGLSVGTGGNLFSGGSQVVTNPIQQQANAVTSGILPTSSGGTTIPAAHVAAYSAPAQTQSQTPAPQGLAQYVTSSNPTGGGGNLTTDSNGNPTGYSAVSPYAIDTSTPAPSDAINGTSSGAGLQSSYGNYQDYVNAVSQAQGYSPAYLQAQQGVYGAQAQGAALGVSQAANAAMPFANNQANNGGGLNQGNLGGATTDYVSGATAGEASQLALQQAQTTQQQTQSNIALNTQQLARTGAISAAQTQLQYNPVAVSGENAINQYNALQQQYPNADIPEYNNALSPATNQQIAQELVSNSPAYQSQFQSTYSTPGGGTGIYSKLNVQGLQQNQDGSYTLVPAAAAALGAANANIVNNQLSNLSTINAAVDSSTKTLASTQAFMNQYGLNQTGVPLLTQIQNAAGKQIPDKAGAIAALNVDLNTLRSDYAQFLIGRGGSVADTNSEASSAIPPNASPSQLAQIVNQMQTDGQNTAQAVSSQVQQALSGIQSNTVQSNSGGSTGGSIYDF